MRRYPLVLVAAWMIVLPLFGRVLVGCNTSTGSAGSPNDTEDSGDASEAGNPTTEAGLPDSTVSDDSAAVDDATGDETDGNNLESAPDEGPPTDSAMLADAQDADAETGPADAQDAGLADGEAGPPEGGSLLIEAGDGSVGPLTPTEQLLYNISPDCLSCALTNDLLDVSGSGANCEQAFDTSDANICLATLTCVLHSGCDATGDSTSCLCGTVDAGACYVDTGGTPLNGPCAQDYYAAYGTHDVTQFVNLLDDVSTSAGSADWLATLIAYECLPACQ
jgi:hypothetical protein